MVDLGRMWLLVCWADAYKDPFSEKGWTMRTPISVIIEYLKMDLPPSLNAVYDAAMASAAEVAVASKATSLKGKAKVAFAEVKDCRARERAVGCMAKAWEVFAMVVVDYMGTAAGSTSKAIEEALATAATVAEA